MPNETKIVTGDGNTANTGTPDLIKFRDEAKKAHDILGFSSLTSGALSKYKDVYDKYIDSYNELMSDYTNDRKVKKYTEAFADLTLAISEDTELQESLKQAYDSVYVALKEAKNNDPVNIAKLVSDSLELVNNIIKRAASNKAKNSKELVVEKAPVVTETEDSIPKNIVNPVAAEDSSLIINTPIKNESVSDTLAKVRADKLVTGIDSSSTQVSTKPSVTPIPELKVATTAKSHSDSIPDALTRPIVILKNVTRTPSGSNDSLNTSVADTSSTANGDSSAVIRTVPDSSLISNDSTQVIKSDTLTSKPDTLGNTTDTIPSTTDTIPNSTAKPEKVLSTVKPTYITINGDTVANQDILSDVNKKILQHNFPLGKSMLTDEAILERNERLERERNQRLKRDLVDATNAVIKGDHIPNDDIDTYYNLGGYGEVSAVVAKAVKENWSNLQIVDYVNKLIDDPHSTIDVEDTDLIMEVLNDYQKKYGSLKKEITLNPTSYKASVDSLTNFITNNKLDSIPDSLANLLAEQYTLTPDTVKSIVKQVALAPKPELDPKASVVTTGNPATIANTDSTANITAQLDSSAVLNSDSILKILNQAIPGVDSTVTKKLTDSLISIKGVDSIPDSTLVDIAKKAGVPEEVIPKAVEAQKEIIKQSELQKPVAEAPVPDVSKKPEDRTVGDVVNFNIYDSVEKAFPEMEMSALDNVISKVEAAAKDPTALELDKIDALAEELDITSDEDKAKLVDLIKREAEFNEKNLIYRYKAIDNVLAEDFVIEKAKQDPELKELKDAYDKALEAYRANPTEDNNKILEKARLDFGNKVYEKERETFYTHYKNSLINISKLKLSDKVEVGPSVKSNNTEAATLPTLSAPKSIEDLVNEQLTGSTSGTVTPPASAPATNTPAANTPAAPTELSEEDKAYMQRLYKLYVGDEDLIYERIMKDKKVDEATARAMYEKAGLSNTATRLMHLLYEKTIKEMGLENGIAYLKLKWGWTDKDVSDVQDIIGGPLPYSRTSLQKTVEGPTAPTTGFDMQGRFIDPNSIGQGIFNNADQLYAQTGMNKRFKSQVMQRVNEMIEAAKRGIVKIGADGSLTFTNAGGRFASDGKMDKNLFGRIKNNNDTINNIAAQVIGNYIRQNENYNNPYSTNDNIGNIFQYGDKTTRDIVDKAYNEANLGLLDPYSLAYNPYAYYYNQSLAAAKLLELDALAAAQAAQAETTAGTSTATTAAATLATANPGVPLNASKLLSDVLKGMPVKDFAKTFSTDKERVDVIAKSIESFANAIDTTAVPNDDIKRVYGDMATYKNAMLLVASKLRSAVSDNITGTKEEKDNYIKKVLADAGLYLLYSLYDDLSLLIASTNTQVANGTKITVQLFNDTHVDTPITNKDLEKELLDGLTKEQVLALEQLGKDFKLFKTIQLPDATLTEDEVDLLLNAEPGTIVLKAMGINDNKYYIYRAVADPTDPTKVKVDDLGKPVYTQVVGTITTDKLTQPKDETGPFPNPIKKEYFANENLIYIKDGSTTGLETTRLFLANEKNTISINNPSQISDYLSLDNSFGEYMYKYNSELDLGKLLTTFLDVSDQFGLDAGRVMLSYDKTNNVNGLFYKDKEGVWHSALSYELSADGKGINIKAADGNFQLKYNKAGVALQGGNTDKTVSNLLYISTTPVPLNTSELVAYYTGAADLLKKFPDKSSINYLIAKKAYDNYRDKMILEGIPVNITLEINGIEVSTEYSFVISNNNIYAIATRDGDIDLSGDFATLGLTDADGKIRKKSAIMFLLDKFIPGFAGSSNVEKDNIYNAIKTSINKSKDVTTHRVGGILKYATGSKVKKSPEEIAKENFLNTYSSGKVESDNKSSSVVYNINEPTTYSELKAVTNPTYLSNPNMSGFARVGDKEEGMWNDLTDGEITTSDTLDAISLGLDLASFATSFVPGYGTIASAVTGIGSSVALAVSMAKDTDVDYSTGDIAKATLGNIALDAAGLIPGAGAGKIAKVIAKIAKTPKKMERLRFLLSSALLASTSAMNSGAITDAIDKIFSGDFASITSDLWKILAGSLTGAIHNLKQGKRYYNAKRIEKSGDGRVYYHEGLIMGAKRYATALDDQGNTIKIEVKDDFYLLTPKKLMEYLNAAAKELGLIPDNKTLKKELFLKLTRVTGGIKQAWLWHNPFSRPIATTATDALGNVNPIVAELSGYLGTPVNRNAFSKPVALMDRTMHNLGNMAYSSLQSVPFNVAREKRVVGATKELYKKIKSGQMTPDEVDPNYKTRLGSDFNKAIDDINYKKISESVGDTGSKTKTKESYDEILGKLFKHYLQLITKKIPESVALADLNKKILDIKKKAIAGELKKTEQYSMQNKYNDPDVLDEEINNILADWEINSNDVKFSKYKDLFEDLDKMGSGERYEIPLYARTASTSSTSTTPTPTVTKKSLVEKLVLDAKDIYDDAQGKLMNSSGTDAKKFDADATAYKKAVENILKLALKNGGTEADFEKAYEAIARLVKPIAPYKIGGVLLKAKIGGILKMLTGAKTRVWDPKQADKAEKIRWLDYPFGWFFGVDPNSPDNNNYVNPGKQHKNTNNMGYGLLSDDDILKRLLRYYKYFSWSRNKFIKKDENGHYSITDVAGFQKAYNSHMKNSAKFLAEHAKDLGYDNMDQSLLDTYTSQLMFDETNPNGVRGIDNKFGLYTSTRGGLSLKIVRPDELKKLNEAEIYTVRDMLSNPDKSKLILGEDKFNAMSKSFEGAPEDVDFRIDANLNILDNDPGEAPVEQEEQEEEKAKPLPVQSTVETANPYINNVKQNDDDNWGLKMFDPVNANRFFQAAYGINANNSLRKMEYSPLDPYRLEAAVEGNLPAVSAAREAANKYRSAASRYLTSSGRDYLAGLLKAESLANDSIDKGNQYDWARIMETREKVRNTANQNAITENDISNKNKVGELNIRNTNIDADNKRKLANAEIVTDTIKNIGEDWSASRTKAAATRELLAGMLYASQVSEDKANYADWETSIRSIMSKDAQVLANPNSTEEAKAAAQKEFDELNKNFLRRTNEKGLNLPSFAAVQRSNIGKLAFEEYRRRMLRNPYMYPWTSTLVPTIYGSNS